MVGSVIWKTTLAAGRRLDGELSLESGRPRQEAGPVIQTRDDEVW